jgi:hypothetical protein
MTPWVLVALLAGFALGWVGRSVRAAGREWNLGWDLADAKAEAKKAWAYADNEERVAHELHAQLDKMFDAGYDTGFSDAAGIDVGGEVDR